MNTHRNEPTTSVRKMTLVTTMAVVAAVTAVLYVTSGGTKSTTTTPTVVKTGAVPVHAVQHDVVGIHRVGVIHQVVNSVVAAHDSRSVAHRGVVVSHRSVVPQGDVEVVGSVVSHVDGAVI